MSKKKIIKLDVSGCKNMFTLQERIRVTFDFPEWYGKNWNAFWDLLWSDCDADKVEITGEHTLDESFDWHINTMHKILQRNKDERARSKYPFEFEIID